MIYLIPPHGNKIHSPIVTFAQNAIQSKEHLNENPFTLSKII